MTESYNITAAHSVLLMVGQGADGMHDIAMLIVTSLGLTLVSLFLLAYCYGLLF